MRKSLIIMIFLILISGVLFGEEAGIPEMVKENFTFVKKDAGDALITESEYKAVLNADFDSVVKVLSDLEGVVELFPNVVESRVLPADNNEIHRLITASYKFFGIGCSYCYVERINIPVQTDSEFIITGELLNSVDGRLNNYKGSWHVNKLPPTVDGQSQVAVIMNSFFDYNQPFFMQELILQTFTKNEISRMFTAINSKAKTYTE